MQNLYSDDAVYTHTECYKQLLYLLGIPEMGIVFPVQAQSQSVLLMGTYEKKRKWGRGKIS